MAVTDLSVTSSRVGLDVMCSFPQSQHLCFLLQRLRSLGTALWPEQSQDRSSQGLLVAGLTPYPSASWTPLLEGALFTAVECPGLGEAQGVCGIA